MTPPGTPHNPSDPTPKPRKPRKRKPAEPTPDAQPAPAGGVLEPVKKKAKRRADEGKRTRPPIPTVDVPLARAVADARRLNGLNQEDMGIGMGMTRHAYGRLERAEVSWLVQHLVAAANALNLASTDVLISAGLSSNPGISPEAAIGRDPRLTPVVRAFLLDQYRDAVARCNPPDRPQRGLSVVEPGE